MRVTLLCVGPVKGSLASGVQEYETRASRYWKLRVEEVEAGVGRGKKGKDQEVRAAEEARLISRISQGAVVVVLTREGREMGSRGLSAFLEEQAVRSTPQVCFVVGGAFGLGDGIGKRASLRLSLSSMTLPHELARLLLLEQLYRAGTILRGEPYHKGP